MQDGHGRLAQNDLLKNPEKIRGCSAQKNQHLGHLSKKFEEFLPPIVAGFPKCFRTKSSAPSHRFGGNGTGTGPLAIGPEPERTAGILSDVAPALDTDRAIFSNVLPAAADGCNDDLNENGP